MHDGLRLILEPLHSWTFWSESNDTKIHKICSLVFFFLIWNEFLTFWYFIWMWNCDTTFRIWSDFWTSRVEWFCKRQKVKSIYDMLFILLIVWPFVGDSASCYCQIRKTEFDETNAHLIALEIIYWYSYRYSMLSWKHSIFEYHENHLLGTCNNRDVK